MRGGETETLTAISHTEPLTVLKLHLEEHFKIITFFFKTEVSYNDGRGTSFAIGLIENLYRGEPNTLAS